jgi:hypothetical protein
MDDLDIGSGKVYGNTKAYPSSPCFYVVANLVDSGFLALWLSSILAVIFGLLFVWGSSDVSLFYRFRGP